MAAYYSNARGGYAANREAVALIVAVRRIDIAAVEVEVASIRGSSDGRRPVIAVAAHIVETAIVPVAAIHNSSKQPQ